MAAIFGDLTCPEAPALCFNRIGAAQFRRVVGEVVAISPFYRNNLSIKETYEGYDCWLSRDGKAGFAVSPDQELTNVFSLAKGYGQFLMAFATREYDLLHLNCLAGNHLEKFYGAHGFEVARREPNWTAGEPEVVFMRRSGVKPSV